MKMINFSLFSVILFYISCKSIILINGTVISKCFYESDFTVSCSRSKLPSSSNNAQMELMRYAKVINGLQHNESLCSYIPGASCSRTLILSHCIDQPQCHIKNDWFSLEPDCPGNSYYTQFEYDCQPAFFMCGQDTLVNAFSGLIYSPSYPSTFRSSRSEACYLTVKLPKDHHAEITLEKFDLLSTSKCIGDYLEIQQYIETNSWQKRALNKTLVKHKMLSTSNNFKWSTLGTMCGRIEQKYKIRAQSDTINFKFRPLPDNHPFLINSPTSKQNNLGFKIFFQAIPPVEKTLVEEKPEKIRETRKPTIKTWILNNQNAEANLDRDTKIETDSQPKSNLSLWILTLILIVIILLLLITVFGLLIFFLKKRQNERNKTEKNNLKENNSRPFLKNQSKAHLKNETEETVPLNKPNFEESKPAAKTIVVLEPEPRKMQAEKPLLLQDLSQSRLLQKFKQELEANGANKQATDSNSKNEVTEIDTKKEENKEIDENCVYGADLANLNSKPLFVLTSSPKVSNNNSPEKQIEKTTEFPPNSQVDDFERSYLEKASKEINDPFEKQTSIISTSPVSQQNTVENEIATVTSAEIKNLRKPVFNPLHVILKDKNKYHTTEFI